MVISGTLFLVDLRRRTLADQRLFLAETTLIAGLATLLPQVELSPYGSQLNISPSVGWIAVGVAVAWGVVAALTLHFLGRYHQGYASSLLTDGGLLYLALEHEPAEAFRALRQGENRLRLSANVHSVKSFRQRMLVFLGKFAACAAGAGFQPYPAGSRMATSAIVAAIVGFGVAFGWMVVKSVQAAWLELPMDNTMMHAIGQALVWLVLALATINHVRRSAPKFALVELLIGEEPIGKAVLTGGR